MPVAPLLFAFISCVAVDGDSLKCDGERIRLVRIDAAERGEPGFHEAKDALRLMVEGSEVRCVVKHRDRYGRLLGACATDGNPSLSDAMLANGLARPYR